MAKKSTPRELRRKRAVAAAKAASEAQSVSPVVAPAPLEGRAAPLSVPEQE
jgi:hypothetical protein